VVHTGRTSYMPLIQERIKSLFPTLPRERFILDTDDLKVCVAKGAAFYGAMRAALADTRIRLVDAGRRLPHAYGVLKYDGFRVVPQFDEIIPIGAECPVSMGRRYPSDNKALQIRFYQNSGRNRNITNNPEAKPLGQVTVQTQMKEDTSGCDVRFVVDSNRVLEVYANDCLVPLKPQRLEDDERWLG
jgi:molecular chaperone DnaK (HSP70)